MALNDSNDIHLKKIEQNSETLSKDISMIEPKDISMIETSEYGYMLITFVSSLKTHSIKIEVDLSEKEILIYTMNIQPKSPGELVLMLKKIVVEMKKLNILYVVQQVTPNDWFQIIKPLNIFRFVNENKQCGFITIKCYIDRFPEAVMSALGFINNSDSSEPNKSDDFDTIS